MEKLKTKPFALLGVNVIEYEAAKLKEVMTRENITWRTFANPNGVITKQWNSPGTPTFYVVDHAGIIRHKWTGSPGEQTLDLILAKLIREAETAAAVRDLRP